MPILKRLITVDHIFLELHMGVHQVLFCIIRYIKKILSQRHSCRDRKGFERNFSIAGRNALEKEEKTATIYLIFAL